MTKAKFDICIQCKKKRVLVAKDRCNSCYGTYKKKERRIKMAFRLSPEFSNGTSFLIVKTKKELLEFVDTWADEAVNYPNEPATIEFIEMTDAEIDALLEL